MPTQARRPISIEDLFALKLVSDPQISPDGSRVIFVQTESDLAQNKYRSHLWMVSTTGDAPPRQFTFGDSKDRAPRWSPDGTRILFVSDRGGADRFYLLSPDGGEAMPLDSGKVKPSAPVWSPAGMRIAFVAKPPRDTEPQSDVLRYTRLKYKMDGEGFWDGRWRQIFVMNLATAQVTQLTDGDCDCVSPVWSPDSKEIAFTSNRDGTADTTNLVDLWAVNVATKKLRRLTRGLGPSAMPSYSPNGRWIACYTHDNTFKSTTLDRVCVLPAKGGPTHSLTTEFSYAVGCEILTDTRASEGALDAPIWSSDSQRLFFTTTIGGATQLCAVTLDGNVQVLTKGARHIYNHAYARQVERFAFAAGEFTFPGDVYTLDLKTQRETRLSEINKNFFAQVAACEPKRIMFKGALGWDIEGWLMEPRGLQRSKKYPLVLEIHGGPHAAYGATFFHEMQLLAAHGYGVIFCNPRGSSGYGQEFVSATHNDWGGNDYRDCMAAVDWALAYLPWVDAKRLGVTGGSYGGYMTNWVVTQTDRFKAAIADRSISNRHSKFGSADISYFDGEWEFDGEAFDNPEFYLSRSPLTYVRNVKTPLLLQHSEMDLRCPMEQAEQFYIALKKLGKVPVEFIRYPNESHGLSRGGQPKHRKERLEHILRWFGEYL